MHFIQKFLLFIVNQLVEVLDPSGFILILLGVNVCKFQGSDDQIELVFEVVDLIDCLESLLFVDFCGHF